MKVLGLIVEYNPFHNGHLYHLENSRRQVGADCVICVMSGNFVQRGEVSIINKWARARTALLCGADLVIELPVVYAMSSAEYFAFGAVSLLDNMGMVDNICFGSESGQLDELDSIAEILNKEPDSYKKLLKGYLNKGLSYPASRENAINAYMINGKHVKENSSVMSFSNNILGIEYLKALKKIKSNITPVTIERIMNKYNSQELTGNISSATSIRKYIQDKSYSDFPSALSDMLPKESHNMLKQEFDAGRGPVFSEAFEGILLASLRRMSCDQIRELPYVSEGLENRIKSAADECGTLESLIDRISTRRYTKTRIQRILANILTGMTSSELNLFTSYSGPQYIRVLGFNSIGKHALGEMNKKASLPVIVKTADFKNSCNPLLKRMLEIEAASTDAYVLGYSNPDFRKAGQEFTQNVVRI